MSDSNTFLATLGFLTYRMLFHSERQMTLCSLLFCMSCAWCITELTLAFFKDDGVFKDEGDSVPTAWQGALRGPRLLLASCVKTLCMYSGLSQYARTTCAGLLDLLQGDFSQADADEVVLE